MSRKIHYTLSRKIQIIKLLELWATLGGIIFIWACRVEKFFYSHPTLHANIKIIPPSIAQSSNNYII